jgi:hypothetical protein
MLTPKGMALSADEDRTVCASRERRGRAVVRPWYTVPDTDWKIELVAILVTDVDQATMVTANALHPGVVRTSFGAEDPGGVQRLFTPFIWNSADSRSKVVESRQHCPFGQKGLFMLFR